MFHLCEFLGIHLNIDIWVNISDKIRSTYFSSLFNKHCTSLELYVKSLKEEGQKYGFDHSLNNYPIESSLARYLSDHVLKVG